MATGTLLCQSQSQLCKEESWERVYYAANLDPNPFSAKPSGKDRLLSSIQEALHTRYCDFRERYIARYSLCKERRNCSWKDIYHTHFFWRKAIVLILLMNALFSTATYSTAANLLKFVLGPNYTLTPVVITYGIAQILFPIIGHVSDTYICRHKVLQFSMWSAVISFAILGAALSFDSRKEGLSVINQYAILPAIFVGISVSYVCFMSNVIPFALDQMQGASHVHYSSFFYWWYWTLNIGVIIVHTPGYCTNNLERRFLIQVEIALACVTFALILDVLFKHWLVIEPHNSKSDNAVLHVCKVLCYILRPPGNQRVPSAVQHELDLSSCNRLQLAKKRFGGKFETEHVENTRTLFFIVSVLVSIGFIQVPYFGVFDTVFLMEDHMKGNVSSLVIHGKTCNFELSALSALNPALLLVLVPVVDLLLVPLLRHAMLHPTILKRIGLGAMCTLMSVLSVLTLEGVGDRYSGMDSDVCMFNDCPYQAGNEMSSYWLFLPIALATMAEIFIYIPGFEFISAQAPYNMRGFLIGLFFSIQGFSSLASLALQHLFSWKPLHTYAFKASTGYNCGFWYYLVLACLAILGVCCYLVTACKYRRRKREDTFNQVGMIEEYFSTGRIHSSRWT